MTLVYLRASFAEAWLRPIVNREADNDGKGYLLTEDVCFNKQSLPNPGSNFHSVKMASASTNSPRIISPWSRPPTYSLKTMKLQRSTKAEVHTSCSPPIYQDGVSLAQQQSYCISG